MSLLFLSSKERATGSRGAAAFARSKRLACRATRMHATAACLSSRCIPAADSTVSAERSRLLLTSSSTHAHSSNLSASLKASAFLTSEDMSDMVCDSDDPGLRAMATDPDDTCARDVEDGGRYASSVSPDKWHRFSWINDAIACGLFCASRSLRLERTDRNDMAMKRMKSRREEGCTGTGTGTAAATDRPVENVECEMTGGLAGRGRKTTSGVRERKRRQIRVYFLVWEGGSGDQNPN